MVVYIIQQAGYLILNKYYNATDNAHVDCGKVGKDVFYNSYGGLISDE